MGPSSNVVITGRHGSGRTNVLLSLMVEYVRCNPVVVHGRRGRPTISLITAEVPAELCLTIVSRKAGVTPDKLPAWFNEFGYEFCLTQVGVGYYDGCNVDDLIGIVDNLTSTGRDVRAAFFDEPWLCGGAGNTKHERIQHLLAKGMASRGIFLASTQVNVNQVRQLNVVANSWAAPTIWLTAIDDMPWLRDIYSHVLYTKRDDADGRVLYRTSGKIVTGHGITATPPFSLQYVYYDWADDTGIFQPKVGNNCSGFARMGE